jgi:DNA-binding transcriptional ArsR family regulator
MSDAAGDIATRFRALADPTRVRLLQLVLREERPVGDLARALGLAQPKVSGHLAVLRRAGLVATRRAHRLVYYRPADERIAILLHLAGGGQTAGSPAPPAPAPAPAATEHLLLRLAGEQYALPVAQARGAIPYRTPRRLPGCGKAVLGVLDVRDEILRVYDLAAALGLARSEPGLILLAEDAAGRRAGLAVEAIDGLIHIEAAPGGIALTPAGPCPVLDADDLLPALADGGDYERWNAPAPRV